MSRFLCLGSGGGRGGILSPTPPTPDTQAKSRGILE